MLSSTKYGRREITSFLSKKGSKGADYGENQVVGHKTAKLRNIATDPVNMALHRSWGLFESIFDNACIIFA